MRPPSSGGSGSRFKHHQHAIDADADARHFLERFRIGMIRTTDNNLQQQGPAQCHYQVGARAGSRDPQHVLLGAPQVGKIHRHRLGPAEQQPAGREQQNQAGDEQGADQIDM
jgi:hypothetical protein